MKLRLWLFSILLICLFANSVSAETILLRRGTQANLPTSPQDGEPLWVTDRGALYVGQDGVAVPVGTKYVVFNQTTFDALASVAANTQVTIIPGTYAVSADMTIPAYVSLSVPFGVTITVATTKTLTINGPLDAGPYQVFSCSGTGKVAFGTGSTDHVYPDWWAVNTTPGTTDMSTAIAAAIVATRDLGIPIKMLARTYLAGDIDVAGDGGTSPGNAGPIFEGLGDNSSNALLNTNGGTIIKAASGATYIFKLGTSTNFIMRPSFKNLAFDGNSKASGAVWLAGTTFPHFENVVFANCLYGIGLTYFDRMTMTKCAFYSNTYGYYFDESVFTGSNAGSGVSLIDIHHRSNDYNMYLVANRTSFIFNLRGGYWSSANIADFYITGGLQELILDQVNLENTSNGSNATKAAVFKIGQVTAGDHIGIYLISLINSYVADNNGSADRPILFSVVDSTDATKPSIFTLNISNNLIKNAPTTDIIDATTTSQILQGRWFHNNAPGITPPTAGTIWKTSALSSSTGSGTPHEYGHKIEAPQLIMPHLNRTTTFSPRLAESGGFYSNEGANALTFNLDADVPIGYAWYFFAIDNKAITINPDDSEGFVDGSGLGKYKVMSANPGDACLVVRVSDTDAKAWMAIPLVGTLTNE